MLRYGKQIDIYFKREEIYKDNLSRLYSLIYRQCTPTMITGEKSQPDYMSQRTKDSEETIYWN